MNDAVERPWIEIEHANEHNCAEPLLKRARVGNLADAESKDVEHVIDPLLPRGFVTLLSSHGGGGKSTLALTLAAHIACGRAWAGLATQRGRVLFVTLEDPTFVVRLRLSQIASQYPLCITSIDDNVEIVSGSEIVGAALAVNSTVNGVKTLNLTRVYEEIRDAAVGFDLVILDNASDAYHASENIRSDVNQFIRTLAIEIGRRPNSRHKAILLLAHIDKVAARNGGGENDYSGSTAWHNSTRSRIALLPSEDGASAKLVHQKSNFRPRNADIPLVWVSKVLVPISAEAVSAARLAKMQSDAEVIYAVVTVALERNLIVSASTSGSNTAYHTLESLPELPVEFSAKSDGKKRVHAAITQLIRDGWLEKQPYTDHYRNKRLRLVLTQKIA